MKKLVSVLPAPLEYRLLEYLELKHNCKEIHLIIGDANGSVCRKSNSFHAHFAVTESRVKKLGIFFYQTRTIRSYIFSDYDAFFIQANFRFLDYWVICILNIFIKRNLLVHGQGLYRYKNVNYLRSLAYWISLRSCSKYVFYTKQCLEDFYPKKIRRISRRKLEYVNNFIRLEEPIDPKSKKKNSEILFVGRLRPGNEVDNFLTEASVRSTAVNVVGDGPDLPFLRKKYAKFDHIKFFGGVIDEKELNLISQNCGYGIYPGNAGLSVLHYAGLGLIPIFHNSFCEHSGPEYQFFKELFDDICFGKGNYGEACEKIEFIKANGLWLQIASKAYAIYNSTETESFGKVFHEII